MKHANAYGIFSHTRTHIQICRLFHIMLCCCCCCYYVFTVSITHHFSWVYVLVYVPVLMLFTSFFSLARPFISWLLYWRFHWKWNLLQMRLDKAKSKKQQKKYGIIEMKTWKCSFWAIEIIHARTHTYVSATITLAN